MLEEYDAMLKDFECDICGSYLVTEIVSIRPSCGCNRTRFCCELCGNSLYSKLSSVETSECSEHKSISLSVSLITIGGINV